MRVIAGRFRSRKLKTVPGMQVRPTPDRLREALFSVLTPRLPGSIFLDVYAGSGAIAIEALSRGASHVVLIEKDAEAVAIIRDNLRILDAVTEASVVRGDACAMLPQILASRRPDIVFLDPPYHRIAEYAQALEQLGHSDSPFVIAQHPSRLVLGEQFDRLRKVRVLKQGDNSLSFYQPEELPAQPISDSEQQMDVHDVRSSRTGPDEIA